MSSYIRGTPAQRFWAKVDKDSSPTGCWLWRGYTQANGYGQFRVNSKLCVRVHRFSAIMAGIGMVAGMDVDHLCGVRNCVFPGHLEVVTHRENLMRGDTVSSRAANKTHCPRGHEYNSQNTLVWAGARYCRTCRRAYKAALYQKQRRDIAIVKQRTEFEISEEA